MTTINIRVDENLKKEASELLEELGLDMTTAMNLFLRKLISHGGIPFEIRRNDTFQALREVEKIRAGELKAKRYRNVDELIEDLEDDAD